MPSVDISASLDTLELEIVARPSNPDVFEVASALYSSIRPGVASVIFLLYSSKMFNIYFLVWLVYWDTQGTTFI